MKLDICICTHNPQPDVFRRVLEGVKAQTLSRNSFQVWIIDNASQPPLREPDFFPLKQAEIQFELLTEPRLGNVYARQKAIQATHGEWLVFVDDDTVLLPDYLANVVEIAQNNPQFGCFGGKLLLPKEISVPQWAISLLPYLAIKDCGDEVISNRVDEWGIWEPPTAGAAIKRAVLDLYTDTLLRNVEASRLGRKGKQGLLSGEDSLMMRGACSLGLSCSYQPRLQLYHYLAPHRFRFWYLFRLLYSFGRSYVILERTLGHPVPRDSKWHVFRLLRKIPLTRAKLCQWAWKWGYFFESRFSNRNKSSRS